MKFSNQKVQHRKRTPSLHPNPHQNPTKTPKQNHKKHKNIFGERLKKANGKTNGQKKGHHRECGQFPFLFLTPIYPKRYQFSNLFFRGSENFFSFCAGNTQSHLNQKLFESMAEGHFLTVLPGADNHEKLHALCKLTYKEQAVWFLNAFWEAGLSGGGVGEKAEQFWEYVQKASVIDNAKATGNALDEMEAHRFLETFQEVDNFFFFHFFIPTVQNNTKNKKLIFQFDFSGSHCS